MHREHVEGDRLRIRLAGRRGDDVVLEEVSEERLGLLPPAAQLLLLLSSPAAAATNSTDFSQPDHKVSALIWLPEAVNDPEEKKCM